MEKTYSFTLFSKEIFSIHLEHNRNSIESYIHELKNIQKFSSLEHRL